MMSRLAIGRKPGGGAPCGVTNDFKILDAVPFVRRTGILEGAARSTRPIHRASTTVSVFGQTSGFGDVTVSASTVS